MFVSDAVSDNDTDHRSTMSPSSVPCSTATNSTHANKFVLRRLMPHGDIIDLIASNRGRIHGE